MKLDGKNIAIDILSHLKERVGELKKKNIHPHFAVILVGDDASSTAYVRQKELKSEEIGMKISVFKYPQTITEKELLIKVHELNNDTLIHGIIIQRPLPIHIDPQKITEATFLAKDVDGFSQDSPFSPPIALAVIKLLEEAKNSQGITTSTNEYLLQKNITILGKGKTAGSPIINEFHKRNIPLTVIDTKTPNKSTILKNADIVISAVGKKDVFSSQDIKDEAIVIGVGMFQEENKLKGDYSMNDIATKASFYTGVPGGVGPVNVAYLLSNVLDAAEKHLDNKE